MVRGGAGYTTAIQNLGKSDAATNADFLTTLDSKHVETPLSR